MKTVSVRLHFLRLASITAMVITLLYALPRGGFSIFESYVLASLAAIFVISLYIMNDVARINERNK
jgi:hypothetical protein